MEQLEQFGIRGIYEVGGHVRDQLLGVESKDIDYAVECSTYSDLQRWVAGTHSKIFLEKPEFLTIRALRKDGQAVDYVMCRRDGAYSDGRHPDEVVSGTIFDDLARRDFTMNAIAKNALTGEILDPHGGAFALQSRTLECVGETEERFEEDPLRILRAFRFMVTRNLKPSIPILLTLDDRKYWPALVSKVQVNRRREELLKCFQHSTIWTLTFMQRYLSNDMQEAMLDGGLWLKPTLES